MIGGVGGEGVVLMHTSLKRVSQVIIRRCDGQVRRGVMVESVPCGVLVCVCVVCL
jgi:hypothetical protein